MLLKTSYKMKPPPSAQLKRGHPLARGLVGCFSCNERSGAILFDSVKAKRASLTNVTWPPGGIEANAAGEYGLLDNSNKQYVNEDQGTIVMGFKSNVAMVDGVEHVIFGSFDAALAAGNFGLVKDNADDKLYAIVRTAGAIRYERYVAGQFPNWQAGQQIAWQWDRSGVIRNNNQIVTYCDGLFLPPDNGNSNAGWAAGAVDSSLGILNNAENTDEHADGVLNYLHIYNWVLPRSFIERIRPRPFCMFEQRRKPMPPVAAAIASGRGHIGFRPIYGANRLRGLRRNALY